MRCLPVLLLAPLVGGCLTYEGFLQQKNEKECEIEQGCNPLLDCEADTGVLSAEDCDFDAAAAHDCLKGAWTCSDAFPGFEQAIPPQICDAVCKPPAQ